METVREYEDIHSTTCTKENASDDWSCTVFGSNGKMNHVSVGTVTADDAERVVSTDHMQALTGDREEKMNIQFDDGSEGSGVCEVKEKSRSELLLHCHR